MAEACRPGRTCSNCGFSGLGADRENRVCGLNPPQLLGLTRNGTAVWGQPLTPDEGWCAQWVAQWKPSEVTSG